MTEGLAKGKKAAMLPQPFTNDPEGFGDTNDTATAS
jgi:hypothetical protein